MINFDKTSALELPFVLKFGTVEKSMHRFKIGQTLIFGGGHKSSLLEELGAVCIFFFKNKEFLPLDENFSDAIEEFFQR